MTPIVVDTSVIIDYTRDRDDHFEKLLKLASEKNANVYLPTIVLVEIFVGKEMLKSKNLSIVKKLLANLKRAGLNEQIAFRAAKLGRESNLPHDIADFVIAATALSLEAELATHNVKHFKQIPKLKLFDIKKLKEV